MGGIISLCKIKSCASRSRLPLRGWALELARRWNGGTYSLFVLHGNIFDLFRYLLPLLPVLCILASGWLVAFTARALPLALATSALLLAPSSVKLFWLLRFPLNATPPKPPV